MQKKSFDADVSTMLTPLLSKVYSTNAYFAMRYTSQNMWDVDVFRHREHLLSFIV